MDIELTILDDIIIKPSSSYEKSFIPMGNSFRCRINGWLGNNGILDAGILLNSDYFEDYPQFYDSYVEIEIDRISIEFN